MCNFAIIKDFLFLFFSFRLCEWNTQTKLYSKKIETNSFPFQILVLIFIPAATTKPIQQEVAELRRQIAIEQSAKKKKEIVYDADVPTEFECCYCTTKVYLIRIPFSTLSAPLTLSM